MARRVCIGGLWLSLLLLLALYPITHAVIWGLCIWLPCALLCIYDLSSRHNILRNYPIIGHLRYILESIRPEIQQYFISNNIEERPYSREQRDLIYAQAKGEQSAHPFGTQRELSAEGYCFAQHSLAVGQVADDQRRIMIGGEQCQLPYSASILNISAMSYGALSANALRALNLGAQHGGFAHNTGEGGVSPFHLQGGDLIWQIGTGYFGCRNEDGGFCREKFVEKARLPQVKMIEIKLSQGAKPAHGGVLPAAKVSPEIAKTRGVALGQDCISPPTHSAFSTPLELIYFIQTLRQHSGGKPVGIKLCLGLRHEFMAICKAMLQTDVYPDFITIDGAEGGTGAAPVEFSNRLGTPLHEALLFVHQCLIGCGLRHKMRLIASAKISSGFDLIMALALGADACNMARPMLFALGCIQARRCHTNQCPTGIATQNKARARAVKVQDKYKRVARLHAATLDSCMQLLAAMGKSRLSELSVHDILRRDANGTSESFDQYMPDLVEGGFLHAAVPLALREAWCAADATSFQAREALSAVGMLGDTDIAAQSSTAEVSIVED